MNMENNFGENNKIGSKEYIIKLNENLNGTIKEKNSEEQKKNYH